MEHERDSGLTVQMHSIEVEKRWRSNIRRHELQLRVAHPSYLVIQERSKSGQICQEPVRVGSWEWWCNNDPSAGARQRKLMQRLYVSGDLTVSGGGHVVADTRGADEVGEDGGDENFDIAQGRQ